MAVKGHNYLQTVTAVIVLHRKPGATIQNNMCAVPKVTGMSFDFNSRTDTGLSINNQQG